LKNYLGTPLGLCSSYVDTVYIAKHKSEMRCKALAQILGACNHFMSHFGSF